MKSQIFSLQPHSVEFHQALLQGVIIQDGESLRVFPQELLYERSVLKKVIFMGVPSESWSQPSFWRVGLKALHLEKLGLTLLPALLVGIYGGVEQGWSVHLADLCLSLWVIFCLQSSMQMLNDVEDHLRLVDLPHADRKQGKGVIQLGWISAVKLKQWGWIFLGAGVGSGALLVWRTQEFLHFVLGLMGLLGLVTYSGSYVGLKYRAWGELLVLWMTGPVLCLGWSLVAFREWNLGVFGLGLFSGLMNASVFLSRHIQTLEMDRQTGILTLPLVLGFKRARVLLASVYVVSFSILLGGIGEWHGNFLALFAAGVLGILISIRHARQLYSVSGPLSAQLIGFTSSALWTHFWVFVCVALGLFLKF